MVLVISCCVERSEITGRSPSPGLPANLGDNLLKAQDKLPGIIQFPALSSFKSLRNQAGEILNLNALQSSTQMGSLPLTKTKKRIFLSLPGMAIYAPYTAYSGVLISIRLIFFHSPLSLPSPRLASAPGGAKLKGEVFRILEQECN